MKQKLFLSLGFALVLAACGKTEAPKTTAAPAAADAPKAEAKADAASGPALVFDTGGKFDKGFNESAYNGAEAFKKETGKAYMEFELKNPTEL